MSEMFQVIFKGPHGDTVESDDPKLDAYKQAAFYKMQDMQTRMTIHTDGAYTVEAWSTWGQMVAPVTFQPSEDAQDREDYRISCEFINSLTDTRA